MIDRKDTNPKDLVGVKKVSASTFPLTVLMEASVGMMEGGRKYGKHNYRVMGVLSSVYIDAAIRHLAAWFEGEDIDPDSGLSHLSKAIASIAVLRDGMIQGKWVDDRPPKSPEGWLKSLNEAVERLIQKYPDSVQPFTEKKL